MKSLVLAVVASVACVTSVVGAEQTWTGTISDRMCGASHMADEHGKKMTDRECALACKAKGAAFVLVSDGKIYKLWNHDVDVQAHAGQTVTLTGDLNAPGGPADSQTIRVTEATAEVAGVCSACFLHEPRQHHQADHHQRQMIDTLQPLAHRETPRGSVSQPEPTISQQDIEDIAGQYWPPTVSQ